MQIVNMKGLNDEQLRQAAQILADELPEGWKDLDEAIKEVNERLFVEEGNTLLAAVQDGQVLGFVGILPHYNGKVFELHPLAVRREAQGRGIGRALVNAIEARAKEQKGLTLWLGADDERNPGQTSFANVNLYENLPEKIAGFVPGSHQTAFYMKMGFAVVGVMPDANGPGKPDIFMAKKIY